MTLLGGKNPSSMLSKLNGLDLSDASSSYREVIQLFVLFVSPLLYMTETAEALVAIMKGIKSKK